MRREIRPSRPRQRYEDSVLKLWRDAIDASELSPPARHVAWAMSKYMTLDGACFPGTTALARATGLARSTVLRSLRELEGAVDRRGRPALEGPTYLSIVERGGSSKDGRRTSNRYQARLPTRPAPGLVGAHDQSDSRTGPVRETNATGPAAGPEGFKEGFMEHTATMSKKGNTNGNGAAKRRRTAMKLAVRPELESRAKDQTHDELAELIEHGLKYLEAAQLGVPLVVSPPAWVLAVIRRAGVAPAPTVNLEMQRAVRLVLDEFPGSEVVR